MMDMGIVHGSEEAARPLVIGKDTVYIHTDIEATEDGYQYHEIQYSKDEYIRVLCEKNDSMESEITDLQLALCDLYELSI